MPLHIPAMTRTRNGSLSLQILEYPANHIDPDTGTFMLNVAHTEIAGKTSDGVRQFSQLFFKFPVGALDDKTGEVDVVPGIVSAFVPAFRTHFQCFVIPVFVLFDQTFQADVSSYLNSQVVTLQKHQQSRNPTVNRG